LQIKKPIVLSITFLMITAMIIPAALAADQTNSPTDSTSTQNFLHADYAYADGGTYANATSPTQNATYWGYDFTIPAGNTILGITVRLDAWDTVGTGGTPVGYLSVELSKDGGSTWTDVKSTGTLTTTQATYNLGGSADTWGTSWTVTQINSDNFRVRVTAEKSAGNVIDWLLDWIPVTITYGASNTAPVVNPFLGATLNEGDIYNSSGTFTDPDADSWTATVDYGDGSGVQSLALSGKAFTLSHLYKDNNPLPTNTPYTVTVTVSDGTDSGSNTASVTVNNVAPTVGNIVITPAIAVVKINEVFTASANFTDPGILDWHTASWDWNFSNPGTLTTAGTIVPSPMLSTHGTVNDTYSYSVAGIYTLKLTVTDKDGDFGANTFMYVVVYDPSAGFVTGGGWIDSPAGAYRADLTLTGKATFGFVSQYKKGATVPTGNTEFQFHAGDLNFKSVSYDWLVVTGGQTPKAIFKGVGTINGEGNYQFMLSAIDGGSKGQDLFRIQIMDGTTVIYDNMYGQDALANPATTISGSIVIH
jgi:hypothetical protein